MKKLFLIALMSLTTLIGYSQVIDFNQTISVSSTYDTICGGFATMQNGLPVISISPQPDVSSQSPYSGNYQFIVPIGVPITYTVHVVGMCGCVFDTTFTETLDSTQHGFHVFQIGGSGFYGVSWTDCSAAVGVEELSINKKLIRVIDETGREAVPEPNRFYIYVYSDGSREKRMIVKG
jgi:hypothetical protein